MKVSALLDKTNLKVHKSNADWIAIIFPVDRPLDMIRTITNITGDATAASVIAKSENELKFVPRDA